MQLLESHNQCPDCVFMDLQVIPKPDHNRQFDLYLNLKYHQQPEEILEGKVKFSLRSSQLVLSLNNLVFVEKNTIDSDVINIANSVFSNQPTWIIKNNESSIQISQLKLGTIEIEESPYQLTAEIIGDKKEIILKDIEGLWLHDISPNKHAILERKVADFIEKIYLKPYISKTIFTSEDYKKISKSENIDKEILIKKESDLLKKTIQNIYQNSQENFLELAKIAELNPLSDFAGGNLTGVNLSTLNLSSSNFSYANLRGADLTDVDFSEANLSHVKLSGADLSGAYLEGTNLENANLQNASLALANVIGANLNNANLTNTNLQNTTLGQTNVKNAVFSGNLGLSEEKKQELLKDGAIFT